LNTHNVWSLRFAWKGVDLNSWSAYCRMKNILLGVTTNRSEPCSHKHESLSQGIPYFTWITNELYRSSLDKSQTAGIVNESKFRHIDGIMKIVRRLQNSWTRLEHSVRRADEDARNVMIYQSVQQYKIKNSAEERELGNRCDNLSDAAQESDKAQRQSNGTGLGLSFHIPERVYLVGFSFLIFLDVSFRYVVLYYFTVDGDTFWLSLSIMAVLVSRLSQAGVVYMTKYDTKKPKWSIDGKIFDILICILGFGVPRSVYRWYAKQDLLAKENQSPGGERAERRNIPQDIAAKTTIADLEFARMRTAYLVENISIATLQIYIAAYNGGSSHLAGWLLYILPVSIVILAIGGYSTFRAVSEPLFRFSDQENILSALMFFIIIFDYVMRVLPLIYFVIVFRSIEARYVLGAAVLLWTLGYVSFEYFTQLQRKDRRWYDCFAIFLLTAGLSMSVVADFLPLCRVKFAFFQCGVLCSLRHEFGDSNYNACARPE